MKAILRWRVLFVVLLLLIVLFAARVVYVLFGPSSGGRVTISAATTRITEPLREDGFPDYVAVRNDRCSAGVTPENNAAVLYWQAMGPAEISQDSRERFFKALGIPPLRNEGDYFVSLRNDKLWDQRDEAMRRPWSDREFPEIAAWLAANEKPMVLLVEASRRPRRFDPLVGDATLIEMLSSPAIKGYRDASRALAARAMLHLGSGEIAKARDDLFTCHRLARPHSRHEDEMTRR